MSDTEMTDQTNEKVTEDVSDELPRSYRAEKLIPEPINAQELRVYYDRLFPISLMFKWLTGTFPVTHREWSFTLEGDIYVRFQSIKSKEELKRILLARNPFKIDIGAIYNAPSNMGSSISNHRPEEKELVFDIDITDYDDVRECCKEADICGLCWPLMSAAIKVVDVALRKDFGFKQIMWVYSGRRGIHCWVTDPAARKLTNQGRIAVAEYLSAYEGGENEERYNNWSLNHPSLERALETLLPVFEKCCVRDQGLFDSEESCEKIFRKYTRNANRQEKEAVYWTKIHDDGLKNWKEFEKKVKAYTKSHGRSGLTNVLKRLVFQHIYPRLDINVSKQMNHLLKSPFCVHPKTGRVCIPINPKDCDKFDLQLVPSLSKLNEQLNQQPIGTKPRDVETDLSPYISYFRKLVDASVSETKKEDASVSKIKKEENLEW